MNDEQPLTGVRKRAQIASTNQQMFIWVAVAAVVVVVCIVLTINFVQRIIYQAKVNNELSNTSNVLSTNITNVSGLITEVNKLNTNADLNLPNLKADDSTPFQVVLDALPTADDRVSLGASLQQKILASSGVLITQISVTNASSSAVTSPDSIGTTSASSTKPTAQSITFNFVITGSYSAIQAAIKDVELTIRPITINSINLQGTDTNLQATITATTYYVPKVSWTTGEKCVPVSDSPNDTSCSGGSQ